MKNQLLHTPEGVRDIYNEECEKKLELQDRLHKALKRHGYHSIQTPTFEFFDIFGKEVGTIPSSELYKFFDREGNTLVLRPDITPSIARSAAKYFMDEDMPIRLSYMGNTFINNHSYQGRLKESTQLGAELIGDDTVDADAEMIAMAIDALKSSGLKDFQISVGHVEFFRGLMEAAGLSEEQEEVIRELIANKNFFGVEEEISDCSMNQNLKELFGMLGTIYDNASSFEEAKTYAADYPRVYKAIRRLEDLDAVLKVYDVDKYVTYEFGMLSSYHYYTGVIFAGYTYGSGEPIVKGGRYDKLLTYFGKDAASIGFAIVVDQLMAAISRQKIEITVKHDNQLIVYKPEYRREAVKKAIALRAKDCNVELIAWAMDKSKADYEAYALRNQIAELTFMDGE
ncbi:ATP phosphoribosyltransferase regulatory subunit [Roseburia sp. AF15-21]|jgi:ATP phosphoribosyltransferase regulatory subunit|uniref:ATP phosphoribosyltransferase regulatory subunit n=1 Tax=unclassified Roseburia TaxID=2637578 RepID=UPI000E4E8264|nr:MULTISPECIES: ATP phosphoribosyltransferase regulatory subunit [unclassified Roseburia]RGH30428.1 ATP phosphoribosyltransferase regulatory subunit [Roseburia sp. AF02-12]RGI45356.1 ATP phosphoribosyltransferase regulatory subunit [Roseburia sp. OM04-10BH]RGI50171.1 ATP phosphoribosyltransferase regulatory subunit [Roseburia sp. OM03-7AC]RGI53532.1 ATP phosphoribosyltransferase regulatory subunit [Roseburia sp. OM03-18]RHQ39753.1 ATP phosphoribosyltransferase regulatory subunit [Roseburia sp